MTVARVVAVPTRRPYSVHVGPGVLAQVGHRLGGSRACVLTDRNVAALHRRRLSGLERAPHLALEPGEASKSFTTLERVLDFLVASDLDRSSTVVALGGGVVGDLGGLAASLFMRGVEWIPAPTTLLAQVDASVGGKTAVNLGGGKNLAGTLHQPAAVFADTAVLATLADEDFHSGLGEVVKSALIGDPVLLDVVEEHATDVLARDRDLLAEVVERCVRVKAGIVGDDEREAGERRKLNLGHTFAHAIERVAGYGVVPHGVAVATGLVLALRASTDHGRSSLASLERRIGDLLARLGLCPRLSELRERYGTPLPAPELLRAMRHDKKGRAGRPTFVLLRGLGDVVCGEELDPACLEALLA